jgi:hypothetical protein
MMLKKVLRVDARFKGADDPDGREVGTVVTVLRKDRSPSVYGRWTKEGLLLLNWQETASTQAYPKPEVVK